MFVSLQNSYVKILTLKGDGVSKGRLWEVISLQNKLQEPPWGEHTTRSLQPRRPKPSHPGTQISFFSLQTCKWEISAASKPSSLWSFVTAVQADRRQLTKRKDKHKTLRLLKRHQTPFIHKELTNIITYTYYTQQNTHMNTHNHIHPCKYKDTYTNARKYSQTHAPIPTWTQTQKRVYSHTDTCKFV